MPRSGPALSLVAMLAAFITYCSMYAFRKPFTAGTFEGMTLGGIEYKIILITTQVLGYMLSKFIGIKIISEVRPVQRIGYILGLMGIAWAALLLFGVTPYPFNAIWLFVNGLPLGMIWGLVFSFLEGRRNTELLGAGMSVSFIVSSGLVKAVGKSLIDSWQVSEFWMPFLTGLIFVPSLLLGVWLLAQLPPPDTRDITHRTARTPMDRQQRGQFFRAFAPGIILLVTVYITLTIVRDLRDNFAVELWTSLGYPGTPQILLTAEIPIAVAVFGIIAAMIYIRHNGTAFYANLGIIALGGLLLMATTYLFEQGHLHPAAWMILTGFAMYLSYVSFHTMLFERWIAHFQHPGNIGFLMYTADSFGYLGSVGILFVKHFGTEAQSWLAYISTISYLAGGLTLLLSLLAWGYFLQRTPQPSPSQALHEQE
ncbi:MAG: DUF5690 family protein [Bacteroidia bacterium]|nr:DUF5690 family protein [Bacteroidia bacterium]